MRLKKFLLEEESLHELDSLLSSEKYELRTPFLWRGKDSWEGDLNEKETYGERKPRSTSYYVDYFVDEFTKGCYPDHPRRRESRFAATNKNTAKEYGDYNYIVVPSKDANIGYTQKDAYIYFYKAESYFRKGSEKLDSDKLPSEKDKIYNRIEELTSSHISELVREVEVAIDKNDFNMDIDIYDYGCPEDLSGELIVASQDIFPPYGKSFDKEISRILENFGTAFQEIGSFFNDMKIGYPRNKSINEVQFTGEYLQISENLFKKYFEKEV